MNLRFVKAASAMIMGGILATACSESKDGPLLKGHVDGIGDDTEAYLVYSFNGDVQSNVYDKIEFDSLGNFEFNPELPEGVDFMEVEVNVDGTAYGAYVERGATSEMSLALPADGAEYGQVTFSGDNADVSNAVNVAAQAYDFMRYFSMEPGEGKTDEEYASLLEGENARVADALAGISDSGKKDYYTKLFDLKYTGEKMSLLSGRLYKEGAVSAADLLANPEYKAMFDRIDISDPMMAKANLTVVWVNCKQPYSVDWKNPDVDSLIMNLRFIDENIKEPANRRSALVSAPFLYIEKMKPSKADASKYMDVYSKIAADYPDVIERYQADVDGIVELEEGTKMPYYPTLTDTEGNQIKLEDLLGKVTYIDVWATWCGPCCREIPHLEKVVERFRDNDKIQFISISVDEDLDAWHKKLDADKPQWAQFVLSPDEHKAFMTALGIQGIPRFILLDAEGRFIQNDAVRPSDEKIDETLKAALK